MGNLNTIAYCDRVMFNKGNYTIASFVAKNPTGTVPKYFSLKGEYFAEPSKEYKIIGEYDEKSSIQFPNTYFAISCTQNIELNKNDRESIDKFLASTMTDFLYRKLMELDDPITLLENRDIHGLTQVKGIGIASAEKAIDVYYSQKDMTEVLVELNDFNFTPNAMNRIVKHFKSPSIAVNEIKKNPYALLEVHGFGFKTVDEKFLIAGGDRKDKRRIEAYIQHMFEVENENGNSWLDQAQYMNKIAEFFHDGKADTELLKFAGECATQNKEMCIYSNDEYGKRISNRYMYDIEKEIAKDLKRLIYNNSQYIITKDMINAKIKEVEERNGFEFDETQVQAIKDMATNDVFLLQGSAGTGKTTILSVVVEIFNELGMEYETVALSGKASDNLTQITGKRGRTIHSLLGYMGNDFLVNRDKPLELDAVIIDEISMVDAPLFNQLLQSLSSDTKLIMVGDYSQLEPIGVGVMKPMMDFNKIPSVSLINIHRQAKESGITVHANSVKNGYKPKDLSLKTGGLTYGNNKDLDYIIVEREDEEDINEIVIKCFQDQIKKYSINDIQVITPTRKVGKVSTHKLNQMIQDVYNPATQGNKGVEIGFGDYKYYIRVGDKVMNTRNNGDTQTPEGKTRPIFNGSTGIVREIIYGELSEDEQTKLIIHFDGIGDVLIEGEQLKHIDLAYASTVHKQQGQTIKSVILALPFHYMLNSKQLLYTAMTRAGEHLMILTSKKTFMWTVKKDATKEKQTNLLKFLNEEFKNQKENMNYE